MGGVSLICKNRTFCDANLASSIQEPEDCGFYKSLGLALGERLPRLNPPTWHHMIRVMATKATRGPLPRWRVGFQPAAVIRYLLVG